MNKIIPFVFVITFWGLFYLGTEDPRAAKTIEFGAIVFFVLSLLYSLKSYLLKRINKQNKQ